MPNCNNCIKKEKEMLDCIKGLKTIVDDVMPQIGKIVLQDYQNLNKSLIKANELLNERSQKVNKKLTLEKYCKKNGIDDASIVILHDIYILFKRYFEEQMKAQKETN